eukprot:CAMPEP_0169217668 /NCGR_PEP_ID=MMETSP1016-20121227/19029_1 /TAXON_ID=342587 /ORGANISM="Karlodinium micrum, Strain CCMP2283" /LENGTH=728 /DNA_ID=CAMNT_0009295607 /DNA_START=96 /DNA_END=2283 /DNA_ORIENTATION=+
MTGSLCSQAFAPIESSYFAPGSRARSSSGAPGDARRYVGLLRGEPEVGGTGTLACTSMPFGSWEPGDRGSAPSSSGPWGPKSPLASARASPQLQLDALAERVGSVVAGLQRQCDADKRTSDRRFQQLEKQLQVALGRLEGDHARDGDWREKFSLLQGSIAGLVDESQALSRRLDSLDERLWSRTSSSEEIARQGSRELGVQLQAFERQARLSAAAVEEAQKRQANRQRRTEGVLEDISARLAQIEDGYGGAGYSKTTEIRFHDLETQVSSRLQALEACANNIQAQLDTLHLANAEEANFRDGVDEELCEDGLDGLAAKGDLRGAITVVEDDMRALERRLCQQLEELSSAVASLRVKAEGQIQRQSSLAERLETAHVPALEALRNDLMEARSRDLSEMRTEVNELARKFDINFEGLEVEPLIEKIERLNQRVSGGESTTSALRREVQELRGSLDRRNGSRNARGGSFEVAGPRIQEQLGAVADQLEALDELASRVSLLDDRVCGLEKSQHGLPLGAAPVHSGAVSSNRDDAARRPLRHMPPLSSESGDGEEIERRSHGAREALRTSLRPSNRRGGGGERQGEALPPLQSALQCAEVTTPLQSLQSSIEQPSVCPNTSPPPAVAVLSRKQSLESSLSCEVAVEQDECVEPSFEDALRERCDDTVEVISPSQAYDVSVGSSSHKSFEDEADDIQWVHLNYQDSDSRRTAKRRPHSIEASRSRHPDAASERA